MQGIPVWATLAAAASSFLFGGFWYSPLLFLKPWAKAAGFGDLDALEKSRQGKHPAGVFAVSGVFAWWLGPSPTLSHALGFGLAVGLGLWHA